MVLRIVCCVLCCGLCFCDVIAEFIVRTRDNCSSLSACIVYWFWFFAGCIDSFHDLDLGICCFVLCSLNNSCLVNVDVVGLFVLLVYSIYNHGNKQNKTRSKYTKM